MTCEDLLQPVQIDRIGLDELNLPFATRARYEIRRKVTPTRENVVEKAKR
jgi:hypothetical protein